MVAVGVFNWTDQKKKEETGPKTGEARRTVTLKKITKILGISRRRYLNLGEEG